MANEIVNIEKSFTAGVSEVYEAWTNEQSLKQWWKPAGRTLASVNTDLEPGGKLEYIFDDVGEGKLTITGKYETVEPEKQLTYSWNWELNDTALENGNYKLTVEFSEQSNGSKIKITQHSEKFAEGIHPHKDGWEMALKDLADYLSPKN